MALAESEASDPETRRRQQAMAHLRAAVAAHEAEREITGEAPAGEPRPSALERFRDDLASIVRPRRPAAPARGVRPGTERAGDRPAPLVLVSAQRIDRPAPEVPAEAAPVRPRRVAAGNLALSEPLAPEPLAPAPAPAPEPAPAPAPAPAAVTEPAPAAAPARGAENFEAFVARIGATDLEDRMEAAAVHVALAQGIAQFARPQVLRLALAAGEDAGDEPSREAGLVAFGRLLREGRIVRSRRGLFEVGAASRYAARIAPPAA